MWTEQKAKLIARYLRLFTFVPKHGTYIDGFAGQQSADAINGWAAELVLNNEPRWLRRFYLCDSDPGQIEALEALKNRQSALDTAATRREIEVIHCDFNSAVGEILNTKKLDPATFCLLDQRTFECSWSTVMALARHRATGKKIELFYFLPIGWIDRAIHATTKHQEQIEAWYGAADWEQLVDLKHFEKALVFKDKFLRLGYKHVWPFPICDRASGDRIMFYMVLASDHDEAPKLMWRAFNRGVHDDTGWNQQGLPGIA
jgi:three-Cys-motif partner protein